MAMSPDNNTSDDGWGLKGRLTSVFPPLFWQRFYCGLASVLFTILVVLALFNSPITGALEAETLRWRFEVAHRFTHKQRSKDITVIYLNLKPSGKTRLSTDRRLATLINKVEVAQPLVVGIDLPIDRMYSPRLEEAMRADSNLVIGVESDSAAAALTPHTSDLKPAFHCGSTSLSVEENGMVAQLPPGSAQSGGYDKTAPFCHVLASLYRNTKDNSGFTARTEPLHFINYDDLDFGVLTSYDVLSPKFDASVLKDKIVLIGDPETNYVIPGNSPRIHKADQASEVLVQAFATQTLIDESTIAPSSPARFRLMLYALALLGLIMPLYGHGTRFFLFAASLLSLLVGSCLALVWALVFIQIWPFLIGLVTLFVAGTVAFTVTDLNERNRRLRQTQSILEKRNVELEAAQTELETKRREIARAREQGMEEERKRIALDLHDDALKELFLASSVVEKSVGDGLAPTLGMQVQEKLREASDKIRRIMANLSPSALSVCGLPEAIENLADSLRKETEIEVEFHNNIGSKLDSIEENQALLIYRIVQEAFNNIQKHSKATKVFVDLTLTDAKLDIAIADNGVGMNGRLLRPNAFGLDNMKYRAELVGAQISWGQSPRFSSGTQVNIEFNHAKPNAK
jgi:signal transduction histidine kinase